ncbi:hypothetical protein [Paenibacillus dakarensis]|uniref:hypothetical protein n=1 Tax=Paenibacillus dakarensis TaxID=1527293 RepID=UPI0006D59C9F|nr:hypothetical protein [Paenibacillus dakarensis]
MNQIEQIKRIFNAKNPSGVSLIFGCSLLIAAQIFSLSVTKADLSRSFDVFFFWYKIVLIIFCLLMIVLSIIRMCEKPFAMVLSNGSIHIKRRQLNAGEIKEIRMQGYFSPVIGVIPAGKRFPPVNLTFRFAKEEEDQAIKALKEWAEASNVKFAAYKQVRRWI